MAHAVAEAIASGQHLLVQAGTGTGKSLAYLVPAILHALAEDGEPVVVATATLALQRQLIERDLPRLAEALDPILPRPVEFAVLKGRHNYVCRERLNRDGSDATADDDGLFAVGRLGQQARALRSWAEKSDTGDRDDYPDTIDPRVWRGMSVSGRECIGRQRCSWGDECFAEQARERAERADIIVTNHAMLSIDAITGLPLLPPHGTVIVDEGHELVDRATTAATQELSARMVERASGLARRLVDPDVTELLDDAAGALGETLSMASMAARGPQRLVEMPRDLLLALTMVRDAGHRALGALASSSDSESQVQRHRARAAVSEVHEVAGRLVALADGDVAWIDAGTARAPSVHVAPLHVGPLLGGTVFGDRPVVVTSATLTVGGSFDSLSTSLGLDDDTWAGLDVGSPFDYARQGILYVPAHLPPPGREGVADEVLAELVDLIDAAGGRTLALFSSWRGVERAAEVVRARFEGREDRPILVQQKGDAVGELVRRFSDDHRSTLLGTMSLWQGVDVPGGACTLVVIDRIPFPRPDDPVVSARQRAVDDAGRSGFREVSVPRAALLLAQGTGRLIRGSGDRGVVAVLDSRLATAGYGRTITASLPPFWMTTDPVVVRESLSRLDASIDTSVDSSIEA